MIYNIELNARALIDEDMLCDHLNQGWEFIKELVSGRIVVKRLRT
jgi:hypothetical protein